MLRIGLILALLLICMPAYAGLKAVSTSATAAGSQQFIATSYGVQCNVKVFTDFVTTATSKTVSTPSYTFTSADIGKPITVYGGTQQATTGTTSSGSFTVTAIPSTDLANVTTGMYVIGSGIPAGTFVKTIPSTTTVELSSNATASASGVSLVFISHIDTIVSSVNAGAAGVNVAMTNTTAATYGAFGSDDAAALSALYVTVNAAGGGNIVLPAGSICAQTTGIQVQSGVTMIESEDRPVIKWISPYGDMVTGALYGLTGSASNTYKHVDVKNVEFDGRSATQSTYNVAGKALYIKYVEDSTFQNIYAHDYPATCIGTDFLKNVHIQNNTVENCGENAFGNIGGSGIGIGVGNIGQGERFWIQNNLAINNMNYGIFTETQISATTNYPRAIISGNYCYATRTNSKCIGDCGMQGTIISNNSTFAPNTGGTNNITGIALDNGTLGASGSTNVSVIGNSVVGGNTGILVSEGTLTGTATPTNDLISGNTVRSNGGNGISIAAGASGGYVIDGMNVVGNSVSNSGNDGIVLSGVAGMKNVNIENNAVSNSSQGPTATYSGLHIEPPPIAGLKVSGNRFVDDQGSPTQKFALKIYGTTTALTNAEITNNTLLGYTSSAYTLTGSATLAGTIVGNTGYNPIGASSVTPSASPWTYTSGTSPETLYIYGGTVSGITVGGITVASASPAQITLPPNTSAIVTYSSAPSASKYIQ